MFGDGRMHQRTAVLDHADRRAQARDGGDHLAIERAVAIHVRRRDEEVGLGPILGPFQARACFLLERQPLAADGN
jgi:hypothetical protein